MEATVEKKERLWNANYTKVWVANFMIFFSFMLLTPLLPIYLNQRFSADNDTIGMVLFGYAVMALVARLFSGYVVDSFPRKESRNCLSLSRRRVVQSHQDVSGMAPYLIWSS